MASSGKKATSQVETEMLLQGSLVNSQSYSYNYFALMDIHYKVGSSASNFWDSNINSANIAPQK